MDSLLAAYLALGLLGACTLLTCLVASTTGRADARVRAVASGQLIGVAVLWLSVNTPIEGPVLVRFTVDHGLTTADVVGVVPAAVALWCLRCR